MTTLQQGKPFNHLRRPGPSHWGWAFLLLILVTAAVLRFWQVGRLPPGLYRDEAFNGLDALTVLEGERPLFFPANNGREPAYIYLTAFFISLFGRSSLALRLGAAVAGTLTTWITYQLAAAWFGRRVGLLAAWVWAITLWPVHLSRIGLRIILLVPVLALAFWLGTLAYRRQQKHLWLAAGLVYGATFYTYLAARFTPLLLAAFALYLLLAAGRQARTRLWPGILWFTLGAALILSPLAILTWQQPELLLGRADQVSILNPVVNHGDFWGTLLRHSGEALGLFLWRGDDILRHNPAGRPVFDLLLALPFLIGLAWCVRHWRRPSAMVVLLWTSVMLGPTILAEDTPHFLRAAGLLPAILLLPAIGLDRLWQWERLPAAARRLLVLSLAGGSLLLTLRDYATYNRNPNVAYLFEAAATDMARQLNSEAPAVAVFVDERFWSGWPSIPFLVERRTITRFHPEAGLPAPLTGTAAVYAWPYGSLDFIPQAIIGPALIGAESGSLARGDLEKTAYPLYVRYTIQSAMPDWPVEANFDNQLQLRRATLTVLDEEQLQVDVYWSAATTLSQELVAFVHVVGPAGLIGQDDGPPAAGHWPFHWWKPGLILHDRHTIRLAEPYEAARHQVRLGLYPATSQERLLVLDATGRQAGDSWLIQP